MSRHEPCRCRRASLPDRTGYVLVLCLLLLGLVSLILAGLANTSLLAATEVLELREAMQRRWGSYSLQQAFLPRAEVLLASQVAGPRRARDPVNYCEIPLRLGETDLTITLWDESAKLNLNTVHAIGGSAETTAWLRRQLPEQLRRHLRLRPNEGELIFGEETFESWGQVIQWNDAGRLERAPEQWNDLVRTTTCWGDGRLNISRADPAVVAGLCQQIGAAGMEGRVLAYRTLPLPRPAAADYIRQLNVPDDVRQQLLQCVTDKSSCYSLQIQATGSADWSMRFVTGKHPSRLAW